jgi:hypothetical protein
MPSDAGKRAESPIPKGPRVVSEAGEAWTRFDDVRGWQMPFRTKGFAAAERANRFTSTGLLVFFIITMIALFLVVYRFLNIIIISMLIFICFAMAVLFLGLFKMEPQMSVMFESLIKDTDLPPEEAVARVESVLVATRVSFTRLSREDPDKYWKDEYSETFTVTSGGKAHIRVYDERPSGAGKATKVYVGPARAESERLVSTLAWRLDKVLPERKPL